MRPNETKAIEKLRVAVNTAITGFEVIIKANYAPGLTTAARIENERIRSLLAEANELLGEDFPPPDYTQIARWARTAILSLAGPVDPSDIQAAKERLRQIVDMIEDRPPPPAPVEAAVPSARYNKGLQEFAPDKEPRLPSCPHYMSGWDEAQRDYNAEMRSEQRP